MTATVRAWSATAARCGSTPSPAWNLALSLDHREWKTQFITDGEIVVLGIDRISDFKALPSGKYNDEARLYARARSRQCRLAKSEGLNFL